MFPKFRQPARVLTIAGSDSGGAAGLQADLKTLAFLGAYGMGAITAVTAQNSVSVDAVHHVPKAILAAQIDAVLSDYGADGVKTGFIGRVSMVEVIASGLKKYRPPNVVIDPVLVNHRGEAMFAADLTSAYMEMLLPAADLLTPNRHEAALLSGTDLPEVMTLDWLEAVAMALWNLGPKHVLIKGGRIQANCVDVLFDGAQFRHLSSPWIDTRNTHGSGDTLSAAICAFLAQREKIESAVTRARQFTNRAIERAAGWRLGRGHGPVAPTIWPGAFDDDPGSA